MTLRVLWVVKGLGPGGAERLLVSAAQAHDRSLVELECAYVLPWKDHLAENLEQAGVRTHCVSSKRGDPKWPLRLKRLIRSGNFDVVHVHSPLPGSVARLIVRTMPRAARPAMVCTEHNSWGTHHVATRWANRLTGRWDAADIAVTEESRESMHGRMAKRAETLAHGIDVAGVAAQRSERAAVRAELGIGPDELVVGTVANFREQKDYPNLLAAAGILAEQGVAARFVAVGQGPLEAGLHAERIRLGLTERVIFTGFRPDAARVMAVADVFTLASKWEGLPVALMEALALGLPVVATEVGGVGEAMNDGVDALLVPPQNPTALASALARVLADDALRERLGRAASNRAPDFDVTRAVRRLERVYNDVALHPPDPKADEPPPKAGPARRLPQGLDIRPATPDDRPAILELCRSSLGWGDDPRFEDLFRWKHDENAFGPSPMWVATDAGRVVALRAFMRWEFVRGGEVLRAVRAVDTATHPDHQGKGLFTALTMHGLDEMKADGVDFVFNTPNDKSRPGYLKMGWQVVGRLPAAVRVAGPKAALATARSRAASEHWSLPIDVGEPFLDWLDRVTEVPSTAAQASDARSVSTNATRAFLDWRYGMDHLAYRAVQADSGVLIVRARRRGQARELVVLAHPGMDALGADELATRALRTTGCHHVLRLGSPQLRAAYLPLPGGGPTLTWRSVNQTSMPPLANWGIGMGDVELF